MAEKESWAAQCHTREDCRENERMRGWAGGQTEKLIRVFVKIEESLSSSRMDESIQRGDTHV